MRTFEEAYEAAPEGHTFSNATEFDYWSGAWCARCLREAPLRSGLKNAQGCPLVAVAMLGRVPQEWFRQPDSEVFTERGMDVVNLFHCIEFRGPGGGGGGEPKPKPDPPDMDGLFPRPERRARMLVRPQPELQRQLEGAR